VDALDVVVEEDEDEEDAGAAPPPAALPPVVPAPDDPPESDEPEDPEAAPLLSLEAFGFALEYKSAYHPPPLKLTAGAESTLSKCPLQCGQIVISGSENFCLLSVLSWHCVHSYS
jgi:hypothetical protein